MTEQDYSLYKIYKEFLSLKQKNFFSFITKKTKIRDLYKERNTSFISLNYHIEHFFIIILILFFIIQGVISIITVNTLSVILIEIIAIVLLILSLLISFIKKVKKNIMIIAWIIFAILLIESSVLLYVINDYEDKEDDVKIIKTYQSTRIHKVTYSIIGFHFVVSNVIKINSTVQIGHYIAMFVIDIIYGFVMTMLTKEFYYELISIGLIDFYIALNESKHELLHFKSFIEEINDKVKRYESEKMFSDVCISKCKCNINLNDDGHDITNDLLKKKNKDIFLHSTNDVFDSTFDFMIKTMSHNFTNTNNLISMNENDNHTNIIKKTSNSSMCLNIDDSSSGLSITKSTGLLLNKKSNRKINLEYLYKKVSTKSSIDNTFDTTDRFVMQSLYDVIYEIAITGETDDKYKEIGVFTCKITQAIYKVFVHIGRVDRRLKQIVNVEFDLVFVEMMKAVDDYRQKIENMYQNLIMSKISNEFREGIAAIVNVIHTIKANASPNFNKDSSTSIGANVLFPVHIDTLNRLSAISECVLIIVADLAEYVNIKSSSLLMNKNDVNKSYYSLMELKLFLEEASKFYISLFRKKVNVTFRMENDINGVKVLTNEMKLKQIITNILSNAIKETPNNKKIIVSLRVIKEESHVIEHSDNSSQNKGTKKNSEADTVLFNDNIVKFNSSNSGDIKIAISIEDEGKGIPEHLMTRVNNGEVLDDSPRDIEDQKDYANAKGLNVGLKIIVKLSAEIEAMLTCTHVLSNRDKIKGTKFTLELMASNIKRNKCYSIESAQNASYNMETFNEEIITSKKQKAYSIRYDGMTVNRINQTIIDKIQIKIAPSLNASPLLASRVFNQNEQSAREDNDNKSNYLCLRTPSKKPNSSKHIPPVMRKFSTHNIVTNRSLSSKKSKSSHSDEIENKIAIVDDSANHRTNLENLIKRYFKKKNKICSICHYEDGAELLGELFREIKMNDGHSITKFIFCDENMMFINGSQCFNILRQCEIKSTCDIKIPFVLCSADANSLRTPMKSIGLEFVYDKPLSIGDLDYIFSSKMVNKIQNNISFDAKKSE